MITIAEIDRWKKTGQDYHSGVKLLAAIKPQHSQLKLLYSGKSSFTEQKLYAALEEIWQNMPTLKPVAQPDQPQPQKIEEQFNQKELGKKINWHALPKSLQVYQPVVKDCYARRNYLHGQLRHLATDEQRRDYARDIIDIGKTLRLLYDKVDYYIEHGELLAEDETPKEANRSVFEVYKNKLLRHKTAKEFISRNRILNPEAAEERQNELDQLTLEIKELENRLTNATAIQH